MWACVYVQVHVKAKGWLIPRVAIASSLFFKIGSLTELEWRLQLHGLAHKLKVLQTCATRSNFLWVSTVYISFSRFSWWWYFGHGECHYMAQVGLDLSVLSHQPSDAMTVGIDHHAWLRKPRFWKTTRTLLSRNYKHTRRDKQNRTKEKCPRCPH